MGQWGGEWDSGVCVGQWGGCEWDSGEGVSGTVGRVYVGQ